MSFFPELYLVLVLSVMRGNFRLTVLSMRSIACLIVHCSLINSLADISTSVSFRSFETDSSLVLSFFPELYLVLLLRVMRGNFRLTVVSMRSTACLIVQCSLINSLADTSTYVSSRPFEADNSVWFCRFFQSSTLCCYFVLCVVISV